MWCLIEAERSHRIQSHGRLRGKRLRPLPEISKIARRVWALRNRRRIAPNRFHRPHLAAYLVWDEERRSDGSRAPATLMAMDDAGGASLDGLFEPLSLCFDAESSRRIADFHIDSAVQAKIDILAQKANDGELTESERDEYEAFINAADFISILKSKARRHLTASS
jgi:hypothetical protein